MNTTRTAIGQNEKADNQAGQGKDWNLSILGQSKGIHKYTFGFLQAVSDLNGGGVSDFDVLSDRRDEPFALANAAILAAKSRKSHKKDTVMGASMS